MRKVGMGADVKPDSKEAKLTKENKVLKTANSKMQKELEDLRTKYSELHTENEALKAVEGKAEESEAKK